MPCHGRSYPLKNCRVGVMTFAAALDDNNLTQALPSNKTIYYIAQFSDLSFVPAPMEP